MSENTFECTICHYGYFHDGMNLVRGTAEKMAEVLVGSESCMFDGHVGQLARLVSIRLEDDTPDGSKGRVIGICEPVVDELSEKWKPGPSEVK